MELPTSLDALDVTGMLVACVVAMFATHCWSFWGDFKGFLQRCWHREESEELEKSKECMEAAFWEASIQQYLLASQCWAHLGAIVVPGIALQWLWTGSSVLDPQHIFACFCAWVFHFMTTARILRLTPTRLRLLSISNFFQLAAFTQTDQSDNQIVAVTAVQTAARFANACLFVDIKTNIPVELGLTLLQVRAAWLHDPNSLYPTLLVNSCVSVMILSVSCLLEISVRSRIAMLLDSESMVSSFRTMLRGVCDGEVLLDSNFNVSGKADCLKTLLMTRHDFNGQKFEQLLAAEEQDPFHSFMSEPSHPDTAAPPCLRVSLTRGKVRVGVDLFHVKVPHLFGKAHHLVAFREDSESRLQQEVEPGGVVPTLPLDASPRRARSARSNSSCGSQATALLQICKELQEMTLMIDANTQLLDVEQAHLSFLRESQDGDASMPSLRRLVQPTDWGSVRDELTEFAQRQSELPVGDREVLKTKLRLRDAKRCVQARRVEVSAFSPPGVNANGEAPLKLHMHLSRLKPVKQAQRHQSSLPNLFENSEESSLGSV